MCRKINIPFVGGIAYIAIGIGVGIARIGEVPQQTLEPYMWFDVVLRVSTAVLPFILGICAGRELFGSTS